MNSPIRSTCLDNDLTAAVRRPEANPFARIGLMDPDADIDAETKAMIFAGVMQLWHPGGIAELRCVKSGRDPTLSAYYDDPLLLAKSAYTIDKSGRTPYMTLNRVKTAAWARSPNLVTTGAEKTTGDVDIERRTKLFIDLDPDRPSGVSASDAEHEASLARAYEIREFFRERGWPDPFLNDSGNGHYVIYRTDEPNDPATKALFQDVNKPLGLKFADELIEIDQGIFNAARIAKIPGVMSDKGYDTPERPYRRRSHIIEDFADAYSVVSRE